MDLGRPYIVTWTDGVNPLLWISGGPGKGKTMMSVFLTQHLEQQSDASSKCLIYFFCDHQNDSRNTATAVLRALIWQLCGLYPELERKCSKDFDSADRTKYTISSVDALWAIFLLLTNMLPNETLCVLDGLDECDQESISFLASNLAGSFGTSLKRPNRFRVAIVSRDIHALKQCSRIQLDPDHDDKISRDIEKFVFARMQRFSGPPGFTEEMRQSIRQALIQRAEGTFLWVGFAVHELRQKTTCTEILETVHELPKGLPAIYVRILLLIEERHRELSLLIIKWVLMATRPLSLEELAAAIRVPATRHLSVSQVMQDHIHHCGPLLKIDESFKVGLIHQSAHDFFTGKDLATDPRLDKFRIDTGDAHAIITDTCIRLIDGSILRNRSLKRTDRFWPGQSALLGYAIGSWPEHARAASGSVKLIFNTSPFFKAGSATFRNWVFTTFQESILQGRFLLHAACYLGIQYWVEMLLEGTDTELMNREDSFCYTPLMRAIEGDHLTTVSLLIQRGADINNKDQKGKSPLEFALEDRRDEIAALLISSGARLNEPVTAGYSFLEHAASFCQDQIVRPMIQAGASPNAHCRDGGWSALHLAAENGNAPVLVVLLENGVSSQELDEDGNTALFNAARSGRDDVLNILLDWETEDHPTDEYTRCLHEAVLRPGNDNVVRMLLKYGADATRVDRNGETSLQRAMRVTENEITVKLLLEYGANPNAIKQTSQRTWTLLEEAIYKSADGAIIWLLLDHGASLHSSSEFDFSLLHIAAIRNDEGRACSALLRHGADVQACDKAGRTPLHYAMMFGQARSAEILLGLGADCNAADSQGNTPLHLANAALLFVYSSEISPISFWKCGQQSREKSSKHWDHDDFIDKFCERNRQLSAVLLESSAYKSQKNRTGETPEETFNMQYSKLKNPPDCDQWWYGALKYDVKFEFLSVIGCAEFVEIALRSTCDLFEDLDYDRRFHALA